MVRKQGPGDTSAKTNPKPGSGESLDNIEADEYLLPNGIIPLHEVRDENKLSALEDAISSKGWVGRPVLVWQDASGANFALTGSHRLAAAKKTEAEVPVVYVDSDLFEKYAEENQDVTSDDLFAGDDDRKADLLKEIGDTRAASLMNAEIEALENEDQLYSPEFYRPTRKSGTPKASLSRREKRRRERKGFVFEGETDALTSARSKIGKQKRGIVGSSIDAVQSLTANRMAEIKQGFFDKYNALKELDKAFAEFKDIPNQAVIASYIHARMSEGQGDIMRAVLEHGVPYRDRSGAIKLKTKENGLLNILARLGEDAENFLQYRVGVRANHLMEEGRENNFTREEIDALLALRPKDRRRAKLWDATWKELAALNKGMLDFAEANGVIDPEARKVWERDYHLPFFRVKDGDSLAQGPRGKKGLAGQRSGIKRLKGGESPIGDPLANMIQNYMHLVNAANKNHAADLALMKMELMGTATKVKGQGEMRKASASGMASALRNLMKDKGAVARMTKEQRESFLNIWLPTAPKGENVTHVLRDGKPVYYEVHDPLLLRSLTSVTAAPVGGATMKVAGAFKRMLTRGVTADPAFMVRNLLRDTLSTWVITRGGFTPGLTSFKGLVKTWRNDQDAIDLQAAGGSFGAGYVFGHDPEAAAKMTRKLTSRGVKKQTILDTPRKLWDFWQRLGSSMENAARVGKYSDLKKRGVDDLTAAFEARDIMDFSMRGDWQVMQYLTQTVPFLGARIQGLHRLGRGAYENPAGFAMKGLTITLASTLLYLWNRDDEDFKALPDWDRDAYYHFYLGGEHYRLPKPFEVGVIFGTMPERLTEYVLDAATKGKGDTERLKDRLIFALAETLSLNPTPQIAKPAIEQWANRSMFTGNPIVGMSVEGLKPGEQRKPWTSPTASEVGKAVGMSPLRIEHLIRGYFGTLGLYALGAADVVTHRMFDYPYPPTKRWNESPVVRSFWRGSVDDPKRRTRYETEMYEIFRELDETVQTINYHKRTGNREEARKLIEKERGRIKYRTYLGRVRRGVSSIRREITRVWESKDMTEDQKRKRIDELTERKNEIIKNAYDKTYGEFSD
jgi:hypothetical protein